MMLMSAYLRVENQVFVMTKSTQCVGTCMGLIPVTVDLDTQEVAVRL